MIIDRTFFGLSKNQRQAIKNGSWSVDNPLRGGQRADRANEHGMTVPGDVILRTKDQSQDDAALGADIFINANVGEAQRRFDSAGGLTEGSLYSFGRAWHTVSDMTSPAHEGYQVWYISDTRVHARQEENIDAYRMGLAVGASLNLFAYTYGQEALAQATNGVRFGSANDPNIQAIERAYSLHGSMNEFALAVAKNEYRRGLNAGFGFDWRNQHGSRL